MFLHYINQTPEYYPDLQQLLYDAEQKQVKLYTSTLAITEVAFAATERAGRNLDVGIEQRIDSLWAATSPIIMVEYHQLIAEDARNLIRRVIQKGRSLKPCDAIHLSTALRVGAIEFQTCDQRLAQYGTLIGLPVKEPVAAQQGMFPPPQ